VCIAFNKGIIYPGLNRLINASIVMNMMLMGMGMWDVDVAEDEDPVWFLLIGL